jgi:murein DD-endopeptidase MepM/ murein hydrolase activator NlpD
LEKTKQGVFWGFSPTGEKEEQMLMSGKGNTKRGLGFKILIISISFVLLGSLVTTFVITNKIAAEKRLAEIEGIVRKQATTTKSIAMMFLTRQMVKMATDFPIRPIKDFSSRKHYREFGYEVHPIWGTFNNHTGIDIEAKLGEKAFAVYDGKIIRAGRYGGYGLCVDLSFRYCNRDFVARYANLSEMLVSNGDIVSKGHVVGLTGSTGVSTGPHLHFETLLKDRPFDPIELYAKFGAMTAKAGSK